MVLLLNTLIFGELIIGKKEIITYEESKRIREKARTDSWFLLENRRVIPLNNSSLHYKASDVPYSEFKKDVEEDPLVD